MVARSTSSMLQMETVDSQKGDARLLGRLGRLDLGTRGVHAGQTDRREHERHGEGLAQHGGGQLQLGHVAQHALAQVDGGEVVDVGPQRRLLVGAAIDVVEQLAGEPPPGQFAVVADRGGGQPQGPVTSGPVHASNAARTAGPAPLSPCSVRTWRAFRVGACDQGHVG